MSERPDRDVLFPWEIERARKSSEAEAQAEASSEARAGESPEAEAEGAPEGEAEESPEAEAEGAPEAEAGESPEAEGAPGIGFVDAEAPADAGSDVDAESGGVGAEAALGDATDTGASGSAPAANAARAEGAGAAADMKPDAGKAAGGVATASSRSDEAADDDERFAVLDTQFARRVAEKTTAALREKPIAQKEYYAISEVCELVGLKPHVLRYWETQFHVLNPSKNRSGNRVYQRKEIRLIMLVKHLLYEEKYTVEGAKAKLDQLRRGHELADATGVVLDRSMVEQLRADLSELATLLAPPARG